MSARDAKMLAVGASVCVGILAAGRGAPVWRQWRNDVRERVVATGTVLDRARSTLAARDLNARALGKSLRNASAADSLLMSSSSPADGAAQLASMAGIAAEQAEMRVSAMQLRADTNPASQLSKASVRITGITDVSGLTAMLQELESGAPLLVVREVSVSQSDPMSPDDRAEQLRVEVTVEGLTRIRQRRP